MPAFGDFAYLDYDSEDTPTFNTQRSYIAVYVTNTHLSKTAACAGGQLYSTYYAQNPTNNYGYDPNLTFNTITYGTRFYKYNIQGESPISDNGQVFRGILPVSEDSAESPFKVIKLISGFSPEQEGNLIFISSCVGAPTPTPSPTPIPTPIPTVPAPPVTPFDSNIIYNWFSIQNESYSKKIFGYYSGSADFSYNYSPTTGSGESGPVPGNFRLDSGSVGSGNTTDEVDSKFLYIDVKDSGSEEDIISYLTNLSTSPTPGQVRLELSSNPAYHLQFDLNGINSSSITSDGFFTIGLVNGSSSPSDNPFSSSYSDNEIPTGSTQLVNVKFTNDALLGYHEVELPGNDKVSFIAAIEQTSSALPSGSIPGPFNTSWGVSEEKFLEDDYYPSSPGNAWMWNDGYKAKHIKMNNISFDGDSLSNFIRKSNDSNFVLYNPKNASNNLLYPSNGNYSEGYVLDNVTRYLNYSHLKVNQPHIDTSFAVSSDNFAQTDFNLSVNGRYIVYATSSGTITHPTASSGINQSIPQGYFPATLDTEQYFRGWDDANYYLNGNLVPTQGDINDPLNGFNSGSTEKDNDGLDNYVASKLPFFINQTSSYSIIPSESILQYTEGLTNLTQIGPVFQVIGGGEQKYFLKEDTGEVYISGSEFIDIKKTANPLFNTLYDVEVVPLSNTTTYYDTGEGFNIEVGPSQSLWLSRGIANPGTLDGDNWKYNRFLHRPYKVYALTSTGSYIAGYSEELYGEVIYREGPYPVGPPPNEFETLYIAYSESSANLRNDGLYTFPTQLTEDITILANVDLDYQRNEDLLRARYGEAEYNSEEYGQEDTGSLLTWETASLKLYKNNNVLSKETIYNVSESIADGIRLDITKSISAGGMTIGDTLSLSVEVENAQSGFNAALIVPDYSLVIAAPVPPTSDLVPVTFDNALGFIDDCDPTVNNVVGDRPNKRLQDVDYSIDISSPINFDQIIKDEAVRATVPESNFTQLGFANQRYFGSSTTREQINEYNDKSDFDVDNKFYYTQDKNDPDLLNAGKGPKLGKVPNIELKNGYIAYFNRLIDPYPLVNGKTAYYVKYVIDESGTVFDPTLSDTNFSILENTFKLQDYDQKPTRTKVSLQNIDEVKELSRLNKDISNTFKVGEYPVPILYSQTSSLGHTNNIILSGSPFFGTLGIGTTFTNLGMRSNSSQTSYPTPPSRTTHANLSPATTDVFEIGDITLFDSNFNSSNITSTSSVVDGAILLPLDANAETPSTLGEPLSDTYSINGNYEFFTSAVPAQFQNYTPSHWTERRAYKTPTMFEATVKIYQKSPTATDADNNYVLSTSNIDQSSISVTLTIIVDAGNSGEEEYVVPFPQKPLGYSNQYSLISGTGIKLNPHSFAIEDAISAAVFGGQSTKKNAPLRSDQLFKTLVAGGWSDEDGNGLNNGGYGQKPVHYKWSINYTINNLKQGSGVKSNAEGSFSQAKGKEKSQYKYFKWYSSDLFMMYKGGTSSRDRRSFNSTRTFTPAHLTVDTLPRIRYTVTSPLCANDQNANGAPGPFWRKVPGSDNKLFMSSSVLNEAYATFDQEGNRTNNAYYVQAKLDYTGDINVVFPSTDEPEFIEFDPVQDPWSLEIGDEIRFENNENLVFTITKTKDNPIPIKNPGNLESNNINQKLQVYVTPEVPEDINLDFFVVRRYKENRNFVILDQQTPYGFPTTGSLEPASAPGILLPEHRIEKYDRNPDEVLKELIEKRII